MKIKNVINGREIKTIFGTQKKLIIFFAIIVAVIAGVVLFRPAPPELNLFEARKMDLYQEVSLTGRTKRAGSVILSFERPGRIVAINKDVGDKVNAGDTIASLDNSRLVADLAQAEAAIRLANAELKNVFAGAREEEINIQRAAVENAKLSLDIARHNLSDRLSDHQGQISEIIVNRIDRFFTSPKDNPSFQFNIRNYALKFQIESYKRAIESNMSAWVLARDEQSRTIVAMNVLSAIRDISDKLALAFSDHSITPAHSQATINKWQAEIAEVRAIASAASVAIMGARERYVSALNTLAVAEKNLALQVSGPTSFQIESASARLESAKAAADAVRTEIRKGLIVAPISGIIGSIDIVRGETATQGKGAATIISDKNFQIETYIPEVDIAKIKIGNDARITLDAYGGEVVFTGSIISIDPGETITGGVTSYRAVIQFAEEDERIKSGMTANIDVMGEKRAGVIAVPRRAVITDNNQRFLNILIGEETVKTEVTTGFRSSDGFIEITSGLSEGDRVLISLPR